MIVRTLESLEGGERDVGGGNWRSRRLLLAGDGMGFSMHDTLIEPGTETVMWYKHHVEAVYCIEGEGEIEVLPARSGDTDRGAGTSGTGGPSGTGTGRGSEIHALCAGTLYALDQHERHVLRAKTRMRMVCVFSPPCTGREVHDVDGAYPLLSDS